MSLSRKLLTRTTYIGRRRFKAKFWKTRERKPDAEVVEMAVAIIEVAEFEAVQALLKTRSPALIAPRIISVAASSAKTAGFGVPSFVPKWRATWYSSANTRTGHFGWRERPSRQILAALDADKAVIDFDDADQRLLIGLTEGD